MKYIIYEITNIVNNKRYIGKHATENLKDGYMGSGLLIRNAIKKYGKDKFSKRILFEFDNETDMNEKETELVTIDVVKSDKFYNIALGGVGGNIVFHPDHPLYEKTKEKLRIAQRNRSSEISDCCKKLHREKRIGMYGKTQSENQKQIVSQVQKNRIRTTEERKKQLQSIRRTFSDINYVHPNKGRKKPEEFGKKISERLKGLMIGSKNPMYGKFHTAIGKSVMSNKAKHRKRKTCMHCDIDVDVSNYKRWHGDNCKLKKRMP